MPTQREHAIEWLRAIETDGVNLTAWEEEFVDSVSRQLARGRDLTEKQIDVIERIYAEKTP